MTQPGSGSPASSVPAQLIPQFRTFWSLVEQTIDQRIGSGGQRTPRIMSLQVPFGVAGIPLAPGYISSIGVDFPCRVVGYSIAMTAPLPAPPIGALPAGAQMRMDIRRSTRPVQDSVGNIISGHPLDLASIVTDYPLLNGWYVEVGAVPDSWSVTEFNDGDMLHFFRRWSHGY